MRPNRPADRTRTRAHAVLGCLLLLGGLAISVTAATPFAAAAPTHGSAPALHAHFPALMPTIRAPTFPVGYAVYVEASVGSTSLSVLSLANGSYDLMLYNVATNVTKDLGVIPGGSGVAPNTEVSAGGSFFLGILNYSTGIVTFEQVTAVGQITTFSLPLGDGFDWYFPYGDSHSFFLAQAGYLVQFDARSHTMIANYSSALPAGLIVQTLRSDGTQFYVGGTMYLGATSKNAAWFGLLDPLHGTMTRIFQGQVAQSPATSAVMGITIAGGIVYFCGGVTTYTLYGGTVTLSTVRGFLYQVNPSNGSVTGLNKLIPKAVRNETIWAVEPWASTIALNFGGYYFNFSAGVYWQASSLYTLSSMGNRLVAHNAWLPTGFVAEFAGVTSKSGGYLFLGGTNTVTGVAQLVVLQR